MTRHVRGLAIVGAVVLSTAGLIGLGAASAGASEVGYTTTPVHFDVQVGPDPATTCHIVADLYKPDNASADNPVPVVLSTNGFGMSKDQVAPMLKLLASRGYAGLGYSGLGFGGSSCRITLDSPEWDGKAASQLIGWLGGTGGAAWTDESHTTAMQPPDWIVKDLVDQAGVARPDDPRVAMWGTSYGGGIQYATAKNDKRIDALVPIATWNDLRYSLYPNTNRDPASLAARTPGVTKSTWGLGLAAFGVLKVTDGPLEPYRLLGCPNWRPGACQSFITGSTFGYPSPQTQTLLAESSVATFADQIDVPTLLIQGQQDTLFGLEESVATYDALVANGTTTKLIWTSGGHSGPIQDDEVNFDAPNPQRHYAIGRTLDWFDHYLRDIPVDTGPQFAYFRPWASNPTNPSTAYAFASDPHAPSTADFYLSGAGLSTNATGLSSGVQSFLTGPGAIPTSLNLPVNGTGAGATYADVSVPGTFATYTSAPLTGALHVAGSPQLQLSIACPGCVVTSIVDPTAMLTLYTKVYDVAPDGSRNLIGWQVGATRIADLTKLSSLVLPAIVHEFAPGHQVALEIAGADANYRGSLVPQLVTIFTGNAVQHLQLPVRP